MHLLSQNSCLSKLISFNDFYKISFNDFYKISFNDFYKISFSDFYKISFNDRWFDCIADVFFFFFFFFFAGCRVLQEIDWARRKDHMQQHSAQHLITGNMFSVKFLILLILFDIIFDILIGSHHLLTHRPFSNFLFFLQSLLI